MFLGGMFFYFLFYFFELAINVVATDALFICNVTGLSGVLLLAP